VLQGLLLICDPLAMYAAFILALHYHRESSYMGNGSVGLFLYFYTMVVIFIYVTVSDVAVIFKLNFWWAQMPILRGLAFRVPQALAMMFLVYQVQRKA